MSYAIYRYKNDEYTPKNGDKNKKTMKPYFKAVTLSRKNYENILKFNFLICRYDVI